jgi:hypothetical protein
MSELASTYCRSGSTFAEVKGARCIDCAEQTYVSTKAAGLAMTMTIEPCSPYALCGGDVEELNNWLAQVRAYAPLAQPTAYRLTTLLNGKWGGTVIDLTEPASRPNSVRIAKSETMTSTSSTARAWSPCGATSPVPRPSCC